MNQNQSKSAIIAVRIIAAVLALAIPLLTFLVHSIENSAAQTNTCTVGVYGYATNVTLSGTPAQYDCKLMVSKMPRWYYMLTSSPPTGTESCEGDFTMSSRYSGNELPLGLYAGVHYVVRDTGSIDIVGNQLCQDLNEPTQ